MSLFAIGDLHLALGAPEKNMEVFGGRWVGYTDKIRRGFDLVREEDLCVICGDTSWAMDLETALPYFRFLNDLPGRKLLLKGNHAPQQLRPMGGSRRLRHPRLVF